MDVRRVDIKTDTRLTPLLSNMFTPAILFTVGPGFPTTYKKKIQKSYTGNSNEDHQDGIAQTDR